MYIVDVNKDLIFFYALLDEATTPKELIFFNALTDVPITSWKTGVEVANSGKTMTFYESMSFSENIRKFTYSIIQTMDYSKGFLRSLAFRIIEV